MTALLGERESVGARDGRIRVGFGLAAREKTANPVKPPMALRPISKTPTYPQLSIAPRRRAGAMAAVAGGG